MIDHTNGQYIKVCRVVLLVNEAMSWQLFAGRVVSSMYSYVSRMSSLGRLMHMSIYVCLYIHVYVRVSCRIGAMMRSEGSRWLRVNAVYGQSHIRHYHTVISKHMLRLSVHISVGITSV